MEVRHDYEDNSQYETDENENITRIHWVLSFHPEVARLPINSIVKKLSNHWFGKGMQINICWKNQYVNLSTMVRKIIK